MKLVRDSLISGSESCAAVGDHHDTKCAELRSVHQTSVDCNAEDDSGEQNNRHDEHARYHAEPHQEFVALILIVMTR